MVLNSAPQILTVFRLTECTLFREVLERCKWEKPILGGASGRPPSPCRYETHSPSSWKMLKGPLSSLYSGSISHSNKVQRRALCQFWKTVTGQYVVGRIHTGMRLSLARWDWTEWVYALSVHCSQKAPPGAMDFCIYFILLKINLTRAVAYVGLSAPSAPFPPGHTRLSILQMHLWFWKVIKAGPSSVLGSVPPSPIPLRAKWEPREMIETRFEE